MTGKAILVIAAAVIVVAGSAVGVLLLRHQEQLPGRHMAVAAHLGDGVPVSAESTVRLLLSARGRQALTPELNAVLPHGSSAPVSLREHVHARRGKLASGGCLRECDRHASRAREGPCAGRNRICLPAGQVAGDV